MKLVGWLIFFVLSCRFWAVPVPDPVETNEEASLEKVQSKTSQPIVNCEKKAS